jgi:hypothetical protein
MSARLISIIRVVVFLVGAVVSFEYVPNRWVVGPVFGLVVLIWHTASPKDAIRLRHLGFLAASTFIYYLVIALDLDDGAWLNVAFGTAALPLAHRFLLGASWRRTFIAIPSIYAIWYLFSWVIAKTGLQDSPVDFIINFVFVWQAAYLVFMFGCRKTR